jgi:hypothetical protein
MHQSTFGERVTAVISTVVAIALLGAAVTAQQSRAPRADYLASLEADLRLQVDLAFRQDGGARRTQVAALEATLQAWRESAQSADDYGLLVEWMQSAIQHTMPGRAGKLPPTPDFGAIPPPMTAPAPPPVVEPPTPVEEQASPPSLPAETSDAPVADAPVVPPVAAPPAIPAEPIADIQPASDEAVIEASPTDEAPREPAVEGAPAAPVEHSITVPTAVESTETEGPAHEPTVVAVAAEPIAAAIESTEPTPPAVRINLAELNARIEGYHQGLDEIEAALIADGEVSPEQLADLVGQLEQLAAQYQFVNLYYVALSAAEQRGAAAPRSMAEVVDLVAARVAAARGGDLLDDFDAAHADQPTLAQRLKALADAVGAAGQPR